MLEKVEVQPLPFPETHPDYRRAVFIGARSIDGRAQPFLEARCEPSSILEAYLVLRGIRLTQDQSAVLFPIIEARYKGGKENAEIGKDLFLSLEGVEFHVKNLRKKLRPLMAPDEDDELLTAAKIAIDLGVITPNKVDEAQLTDCQLRALYLLRQNLSNKKIASRLGCSMANLEELLTEIFRRTGFKKGSQLAATIPSNVTRLHSV